MATLNKWQLSTACATDPKLQAASTALMAHVYGNGSAPSATELRSLWAVCTKQKKVRKTQKRFDLTHRQLNNRNNRIQKTHRESLHNVLRKYIRDTVFHGIFTVQNYTKFRSSEPTLNFIKTFHLFEINRQNVL